MHNDCDDLVKGMVAMFVGGLVMALIGTVQVLNAERKIESNISLS
jgi:hypothetical protein